MSQSTDLYPAQQPQIKSSLTWRLLDGDAVIVSPHSGEIRVLNHAGALIWQLLDQRKPISEIVAALTARFGIPESQAQADLDSFLRDLNQRGLILWEAPA